MLSNKEKKRKSKKIEVIRYPLNFKYFLKFIKPFFKVTISKIRESKIKNLLN
jgi:hypothetical protein